MGIDELVQWQIWDTEIDACFPWFTHPFLEVIKNWNVSDKSILEWGAGRSTRWWRKKAKWVTSVDTSSAWKAQVVVDCYRGNTHNGEIILFDGFNEGSNIGMDEYLAVADSRHFDIVIIDGIHRHGCLAKSLTLPRPLTIIHDNWQQDGFICKESEDLMKSFYGEIWIQPDHTDHHGNPWQTAFWEIPA